VLDTVGEVLAARVARGEEGFTATAYEALESANQRVRELGVGAATTFAGASIRDTLVRTLHVGDSEVVMMGQRGAIRLQTVSHSPVGYAREAGLLDEEEALLHEDRHIVSNMIGAEDMRVEIAGATRMAPHDTLLLASDGLFDNLFLGEIVEICRKGPLERAADQLEQRAWERMSGAEPGLPCKADDLSFILFRRASPPRGSGP
jgi:serine/threonine protein phosphatase PrpC